MIIKMKKVKCSAKDCNRIIEAPDEAKKFYCSYECACYDGAYNVNTGWVEKPKET